MTLVEWVFTHPALAVSHAVLFIGWAMLATVGLWWWIGRGVLQLREHWRSGWRYWPKANFMESLFWTLAGLMVLLLWLRVYLWSINFG